MTLLGVRESVARVGALSLWSLAIAVACSGDDTASMANEVDGGDGGAVRQSDAGLDADAVLDATADEVDANADARDADTDAAGQTGGGTGGATDAGAAGQAGAGGGAQDGGGGSGGTDAGSGGEAGAAGAAGEPAPTTCYDQHAGVLICDDFEDGALAGWTHHARGSDGRSVHTGALTHGGSGALDSTKLGPGDSDPIYKDALGQRTSGHIYLRGYLRVPSGFAIAPEGSRASLLVLGEDTGALGGLSLVLWQNELSLQINGMVMSEIKAVHALPRDAWLCVQIDFEIASAATVRLRVDGETVVMGTRNTLLTTHYERLWLGVNWIAPEQIDDVRVLYDDVFVGTQDIPCD